MLSVMCCVLRVVLNVRCSMKEHIDAIRSRVAFLFLACFVACIYVNALSKWC